jgi:L-ascorbate metabolism protein UlaG (beta-lactamase superfamily)
MQPDPTSPRPPATAHPGPRRGAARAAALAAVAVALAACATAPLPKAGPYHASDADLTVTRIVHGSVLLDFAGERVLVDPWFYPRGLVNQREPLGLTFRTLPPIHVILVTHGHGDHLDRRALEELPDRGVPVVVRRGLRKRLVRAGYTNVTELDWWEATTIGDVTVHAVPADHPVAENGYVVQRGAVTVYTAGDTRYFGGLRDVARRFRAIDVALLPIGGLRVFGRLTEMRPADAARAAAILRPRRVIPTHYGLAAPPPVYWVPDDPVGAFERALAAVRLPDTHAVVLETGESWHYYR